MKKINLGHLFFFIILCIIVGIATKYNSIYSAKNDLSFPKCSNLSYKKSLNLHPDKFKSTKLNLKILDNRRWNQILFEEEVQAKATQLKFNSDYKVYSNRKRAKALFEVEMPGGLKCSLLASIRPHGDLKDHRSSNSLPSLNVNITDGHLFGIVKFILFKPYTRTYDNEIFVTTLLRELNLLAPRSANFTVTNNNRKYKFIFQEKIEKEFIENFSKVENPIFKGDERFTFTDKQRFAQAKTNFNHTFKIVNDNFLLKDNSQKFITEVGLSILNEISIYYQGDVDEDDIFDFYAAGKKADYKYHFENFKIFDALLFSMDSTHSMPPGNRRIYFDSTFKTFHPIYYDGEVRLLDKKNKYIEKTSVAKENKQILRSVKHNLYAPGMFEGKVSIAGVEGADKALNLMNTLDVSIFKNKLSLYGVEIEKNDLNNILEGIVERLKLLRDFKKERVFQFKENINPSIYIKSDFNYKEELNKSFFKEDLKRRLVYYGETYNDFISCNISGKGCINLTIDRNDIPKLISQRFEDKKGNKLIFLGKKKNNSVSEGWFGKTQILNYNIAKSNQKNISTLKIKTIGEIDLKFNKNSKEILITKNDNNGRVVFHDGSLQNWKIDFTDNTKDNNLLLKSRDNNGLTGCISFIDMNVQNITVETKNSTCEDAINFIRSKGKNINITAYNSISDSMDADFSELRFDNILIENSKNDCLDFSFGKYELKKVSVSNCGDKGVSVGENSSVFIKEIIANNTNTGVVSKDFSKVEIESGLINNSKTCYESYNKKQEFSGAYLFIKRSECINSSNIELKDSKSIIEYGQI